MKQIAPYLFFEGNCREAITFYNDCFEGELSIMTVGESPMAEKSAPEDLKRILHAAIMKDKQLMLMASDTMVPGQKADMGEGVYNTIICSNKEEFESFFNKLSAGGKIVMPMEKAFFGYIGSLSDKFGTKWMLEFDETTE